MFDGTCHAMIFWPSVPPLSTHHSTPLIPPGVSSHVPFVSVTTWHPLPLGSKGESNLKA